jgi:hypothetical protein
MWQFMAADLIADPKMNHTFVHDLESAYYLVFWLSIRFLPNSWSPEDHVMVMHRLFNPVAFPDKGASSKKDWMVSSSVKETSKFIIIGNLVLIGLIRSLNKHFHAHIVNQARVAEVEAEAAIVPSFGLLATTPSVNNAPTQEFLHYMDSHEGVINMFKDSLYLQWPKDEPATKQHIPDMDWPLARKSKSYVGRDIKKEGSSQKRLHTDQFFVIV